jgi:uncharacterized protein with HEPN domain
MPSVSREWRFYLDDMIACCDRILSYSRGLDRSTFNAGGMAYDAIIRNVELLGEAAKHVPDEVRASAPEIEWRGVIAVRNILIHGYFSVDNDILWDIVSNKIAPMRARLQSLKTKGT